MSALLTRSIDIRRGEGRAVARAFSTLFLILSGYTVLETARDALLLTRLPLRAIGIAYVAAAVCVLPASGWAAHSSQRFGVRLTLVGGLLVEAALLCLLFAVPTNGVSTVAIYAACSLVGGVIVPLFWGLWGSSLTVVQARRLLGPVGAAGALGAAVGSGAAAGILNVVHTKALILVAAGVFVGTSTLVALGPVSEARKGPLAPGVRAPTPLQVGREEPFVWRIAALAVSSTAAVVALDYFFKWSVARNISHQHVARFIAVFYAVLNAVALLGQLLGSASLVRRMGVAAALVVTRLLLFCGATGTFVTGGALAFVLVLKTTDGLLRNSVHRIATELIYLPVRATLRAAAKPFVDGALTRAAQAAVGAALLGLGGAHYLSPSGLAGGVLLLVALWLALAITTRRPYLALLARAVKSDSLSSRAEAEPVDLETAEELVQHLADEDPLTVIGSMNALARRGRERLIPALVLLHQDEAILLRALAIFAASKREDWVTRARRLLRDPRDQLRIAAVRALAAHRLLQSIDLNADSSPRLQGYAALQFALERESAGLLRDSRVSEVVSRSGQAGEEARIGLLLAIADAEQDERLLLLLRVLEGNAGETREWTEALARAVGVQRAADMIPALISRITERGGREAIRASLVSFGQPALDEIWRTLLDSTRERALRIQLPASIARFGGKRAAERLLESIETESDGRIRYQAIRGLGQVVAEHALTLDRVRVERLSYANLLEYFRILGLLAPLSNSDRVPLSAQASRSTTERLLAGLLEDKLRQALERTFRLLKIAHPYQDIHRVNVALTSKDLRARANAAEFLDTLLRRPDQRSFRRLFQVLEDDLSYEERVARAVPLLHAAPPQTRGEALERLERDRDATVAALAAGHLAELVGEPVSLRIGGHWVGRVDTNSLSPHAGGNPDV